jgi:hypothetical protein
MDFNKFPNTKWIETPQGKRFKAMGKDFISGNKNSEGKPYNYSFPNSARKSNQTTSGNQKEDNDVMLCVVMKNIHNTTLEINNKTNADTIICHIPLIDNHNINVITLIDSGALQANYLSKRLAKILKGKSQEGNKIEINECNRNIVSAFQGIKKKCHEMINFNLNFKKRKNKSIRNNKNFRKYN